MDELLIYAPLISIFVTIIGWFWVNNTQTRILDRQHHQERLIATMGMWVPMKVKQLEEFHVWVRRGFELTTSLVTLRSLAAEGITLDTQLKERQSKDSYDYQTWIQSTRYYSEMAKHVWLMDDLAKEIWKFTTAVNVVVSLDTYTLNKLGITSKPNETDLTQVPEFDAVYSSYTNLLTQVGQETERTIKEFFQ